MSPCEVWWILDIEKVTFSNFKVWTFENLLLFKRQPRARLPAAHDSPWPRVRPAHVHASGHTTVARSPHTTAHSALPTTAHHQPLPTSTRCPRAPPLPTLIPYLGVEAKWIPISPPRQEPLCCATPPPRAAAGERRASSTGAAAPRSPPRPQVKPRAKEFLWRATPSHLPLLWPHHRRQPHPVAQLPHCRLYKLHLGTELLLDLSCGFPNHRLKLAPSSTTTSEDLIIDTSLRPPYGPANPTTSFASAPCAPTSTPVPPSTYCPTPLIVPPPADARHSGQPH
jgi:hypothetical protein